MRPVFSSRISLLILLGLTLAARGPSASEQLTGTAGDDLIVGSAAADNVDGGDGEDIIHGGDGDDTLSGGSGNDVIHGGEGDDLIVGGNGLDILYGGRGADRFVFDLESSETDQIADFDPAQGDEIWVLLGESAEARKITLSRLRKDSVGFKFTRSPVNRVRLDADGDVEMQLRDKRWLSLVKTGRADLKVKVKQSSDAMYMKFSQRF